MAFRENQYLNLPIRLKGCFSPDECAQVLALCDHEGRPALLQRTDDSSGYNEHLRKATSYSLEPVPANRWIWERVGSLLHDINERYFHFRIDALSPLNVLEYEPGGLHCWHSDVGTHAYSCRKLSCVVFLTPPQDYQGGRLLFFPSNQSVNQDLGTAVVFPSYLVHQVEPVSEGIRRTLVCWAKGDAFQ